MTSRRMDFLPWQDVAAAIKATGIVFIPVGAVEPHGFHAPVGADIFIATEVAERVAAKCDGLVFPPMPLGTCEVIYGFRSMAGTISIDAQLLVSVYTAIGKELVRQGFRRLIFVNGHACNAPMLMLAQYAIRNEADTVEVGILEWWSAAHEEIAAIKGFDFGNHADEIETSLLLATAGREHVDLTKAVINSPRLENLKPNERAMYLKKVPFTRTWNERWVGHSGNMGDPTKATADKGQRLIDRAVDLGLQLLKALDEQQPRNTERQ